MQPASIARFAKRYLHRYGGSILYLPGESEFVDMGSSKGRYWEGQDATFRFFRFPHARIEPATLINGAEICNVQSFRGKIHFTGRIAHHRLIPAPGQRADDPAFALAS